MKILDISLHIGSRDFQHICEQIGHEVDVWSISDHHRLMGWERKNIEILNQHTWRNLNQDMCDKFYERYKDELEKYDAFYCFYSPTFAMLYEKFDKPIIIHVPLRYETPFTNNPGMWNYYNEYIVSGVKSKKIILTTNNKYDQKYLKLFLAKNAELIPSICDYTNAKYSGDRDEFLFYSKFHSFLNYIKVPNIVDKNSLHNYSWKDIADFKSIVHLPYSNTYMSLFEQYSMNIPLIFPSYRFLYNLWRKNKNEPIMNEISWNKIFGLPSISQVKYRFSRKIKDSTGYPDPNNYDSEQTFNYWIPNSDFYDEEWFPFIEYFDTIVELEYKMYTLNFKEISEKMKEFNVIKREKILNKWSEVLNKI